MKLYPHQEEALKATTQNNKCAYYLDMGLGKTFVGSEKMYQLNTKMNLVICQKSKVNDWYNHFKDNYDVNPCDLTKVKAKDLDEFIEASKSVPVPTVYVINYDLVWRRKQLLKLTDFTLMLDESSLIQNEQSKRSKFIMKMNPQNVILLSGTPCSGRYENLWSQLHLLGWNINKQLFWNTYVDYHWDDSQGFPLMIIDGYKNVDRLKRKMREYGCYFLKTEDCIDLPEQINQKISIAPTKDYIKFKKDRMITVNGEELIGDTLLTKLLYQRQLCGQYCEDKIEAFKDLVDSTEDRLIVFYNFYAELDKLLDAIDRPYSIVNGQVKALDNYEEKSNSITFIQYQAGSMGLNLQKANKIIYFTPPLSSEFYEQSRKRINRIGQNRTCFYYQLTVNGSIEERIYRILKMRRDYTNELFEEEEGE